MKKCIKKSVLILLLILLASCETTTSSSIVTSSNIISNSESNNSSSSFISSSSSKLSNISSTSTTASSTTSNVLSSSTNIKENREIILDIYASNDIHGRISENSSEYEPGISKLSTFLKEKKSENEEGFIYLNSGDYWQDTYESGYNKGKLLTECLDVLECETMSLGNHEFDWGIDLIKDNKQYTNTTFLGANIRNYPNTNEQVDFAEPYKIIERNGLKIGIIGAIGKDQISSITSSNWENITFLDHTNIVKDLSDELRTKEDCDVVVLSIHADESVTNGNEITSISPISNKKYFDAVFCAHTHQNEIKYYNSVPFVQSASHGKYLGHVQLKYYNGNVNIEVVENINNSKITNCKSDEEIDSIIEKYFDNDYLTSKNKIHGTISGYTRIDSAHGGALLAKATYDILQEGNIDVDIVINNGVRDVVSSGSMTSEKIFNMLPFTNKTIVANSILGKDILLECKTYSNPYYMSDSSLTIEENKYYTVACIDYMMLHKNANRVYNYFSSFDYSKVIYTIETYPNVIVENYLQKNSSINLKNYETSNYNCL